MPTPRSGTLEDSARELASRIAATLPAQEKVAYEIRNISSLQPDEVAHIEDALKIELQKRGVHIQVISNVIPSLVITLSENIKSYVWTAEIHQADPTQVVVMAAARPSEDRIASSAMPMTLRSEKFWEGSEHILDAGIVPDQKGGSWLILLMPDGVKIQETGSSAASKVEIASDQTSTRDPKGSLSLLGSAVMASLEPQVCTVMLETGTVAECHSASPPAPTSARDRLDLIPLASIPENRSGMVMVRNQCGKDQQFLVTGAGDLTQPDFVQLYELQGARSFPVSEPLNFAGAVVALHANNLDSAATSIVRNVATGIYEAYRLSISCSH
jgi:hypothetical protein